MAVSERANQIARSILQELKREYTYDAPEADAETIRYYEVVAQGFLNVMGGYIDGISNRVDALSESLGNGLLAIASLKQKGWYDAPQEDPDTKELIVKSMDGDEIARLPGKDD